MKKTDDQQQVATATCSQASSWFNPLSLTLLVLLLVIAVYYLYKQGYVTDLYEYFKAKVWSRDKIHASASAGAGAGGSSRRAATTNYNY